jgi:hypothetical protein
MKAKLMVSSIALIGGMALAMPVLAQTQSQQSPGAQPAPMNSQMNSGQDRAQATNPMPAGKDQSADQTPATGSDQSQAQMQNRKTGMSQDRAQNEEPAMRHKMRHHMRNARVRRRENEGNGGGAMGARYGTDVAPGGGVYTRRDVAEEAPGRMSHPGAGSPRAPSDVAKGSLARVDQAENAETARLNEQQLNGNGQTATLPNNE